MKIVLLDSNSLINRAFYALPPMNDKNGRPTNGVYGYISMLSKIINDLKPTHLAAAFDVHAPTFRHGMYDAYKATRKPMPDDLRPQIPMLKEVLAAMNIKILELAGYEADDVLGTASKRFPGDTVIVTGDRDSLQLIDQSTRVWLTKKGISEIVDYDLARLKDEGLTPSQIIDLKSLMGDSSDNIPGVAGVGEKTAMDLISRFGTLDGVYANIGEIKGKLKEKLEFSRDIAYLSRTLATIDTDVPLPFALEDILLDYPFPAAAKEALSALDFGEGLTRRFLYADAPVKKVEQSCIFKEIADEAALNGYLAQAKAAGRLAVVIDKDISLAYNAECVSTLRVSQDLLGGALTYDAAMAALSPLFNGGAEIICYDAKALMRELDKYGIPFTSPFDDLMLAAYIDDSGKTYESAREVLERYGYPGDAKAAAMIALIDKLKADMEQAGSLKLYREVELPLVRVLFDMETAGFSVDKNILDKLSEKFSAEIASLSQSIFSAAGGSFNINSPRQLAELLYDKLGLKGPKSRSTGADVLAEIEDAHPVVSLILKYRQVAKLQSTYIDGIKNLIDKSGKVHTVFRQAATSTGRLSSTEPNLQNIPIREEIGREIRRMFIASPGNLLVCADYSQIELRLLAHYSGDEKLIYAYNHGADIHRATAAEVYGVTAEEVTPDMRRSAKAVNFGIIYGISDYGLSHNTGVSVKRAHELITKYFETYPGVKAYMDSSVEFAKEHGYTKTITGRIRRIPEIRSPNFNVRSFGERAAMNMPLQGSAADIIKIAMIELYKAMKTENLNARLILQVHDELIVDAPLGEVERVKELMSEKMSGAAALKVPLIAEAESGENWRDAK